MNGKFFLLNFVVEVCGNWKLEFFFDVKYCYYIGYVYLIEGLEVKVVLSNCDGLVRRVNVERFLSSRKKFILWYFDINLE